MWINDIHDCTRHDNVILYSENQKDMKKYLAIILPWGKYIYKKIPIYLNISAGLFQRKTEHSNPKHAIYTHLH